MLEIELKSVTKTYRKFNAVEKVSFTIREGETVGLVGESGCGKSTVAGLIAGLIQADSGEIWFNEKNIRELKGQEYDFYRRNIQMVFQDSVSSFNPRFTAGQCIAEPIESLLNLNIKERKDLIEELLAQVGLNAEDYHKYPRQFSGGQRQRICIARAIAIKPKFLLLDEVTSNLDVSVQAQILNLLVRLKEEYKMGCLFISHDFGVVRYMCDKTMVMYRGNIVEMLADTDLKNVVHPYAKLLLASVPTIRSKISSEHQMIRQTEKSAVNACSFYDRCLVRKQECKNNLPPMKQIGDNHWAACFGV